MARERGGGKEKLRSRYPCTDFRGGDDVSCGLPENLLCSVLTYLFYHKCLFGAYCAVGIIFVVQSLSQAQLFVIP